MEESQSNITTVIESLKTPPDFAIICNKTLFRAHRVLFGAVSNHLLQTFLEEPTGSFNFVMDEGIQPADLENLLHYVYKGEVRLTKGGSSSGKSSIDGFLMAAKQLQIDAINVDRKAVGGVVDYSSEQQSALPQMNRKLTGTICLSEMSSLEDDALSILPLPEIAPAASASSSGDDASEFKVPLPRKSKRLMDTSVKDSRRMESAKSRQGRILNNAAPTIYLDAEKEPTFLEIFEDLIPEQLLLKGKMERCKVLKKSTLQIKPNLTKAQRQKEIEKAEKLPGAEGIRKLLGKPILSSTKLYPENPKICDKIPTQNRSFSPRAVSGPKSLDQDKENSDKSQGPHPLSDDARSNGRRALGVINTRTGDYLLPTNNLGPLPILSKELTVALKGKDKGQPFSVAELVNRFEKNRNSTFIIKSEVGEPPSTVNMAAPPPKKGILVKRKITKTAQETEKDTKRTKVQRMNTKKGDASCHLGTLGGTDDSTFVNIVRKKMPLEKRRRVAASTRPIIYSTSEGALSTAPSTKFPTKRQKLAKYRVPLILPYDS